MLEIEKIVSKLQDRNLKEVSRRTGIPYTSLSEIARGVRTNPTYKILKPLCDYLEGKSDSNSAEQV